MTRTTLVLMLVAGLMAGVAGIGSALFTSTASVGSNTFTTGNVQLTTNPTTTLVTFSNMAPGDQFTAPIFVTNTGSLNYRYAVTSVVTSTDEIGLAAVLVMKVKAGTGVTCTNAGFTTGGTQVYTGTLGSVSPGTNVIGDQTKTGQAAIDAGDRDLAAGTGEELCFNVTLPFTTSNTYEGANATATFTFAAEQTKNNPNP